MALRELKYETNQPAKINTVDCKCALPQPKFKAIDHTNNNICGITSEGALMCLGFGDFGVLGDGTTTGSATLVPVAGMDSGVTAIALSHEVACALKDGRVYCWGDNSHAGLGQRADYRTTAEMYDLGLDPDPGLLEYAKEPLLLTALGSGVKALSGKYHRYCAITASDSVMCWGGNWHNVTDETYFNIELRQVQGLSNVKSIAVAGENTCALTYAGEVYCWGLWVENLGNGPNYIHHPMKINGMGADVKAIATGPRFGCAITAVEDLYCWGDGYSSPLILGRDYVESGDALAPVKNPYVSAVKSIALGYNIACVTNMAGELYCWGQNDGQLDIYGDLYGIYEPLKIAGFPGGVSLVSADALVVASAADGLVYFWGNTYPTRYMTQSWDYSKGPAPLLDHGYKKDRYNF